MMTQPSTTRILDVVRQELAENVLPVTTDGQAQASLQMIDHILATVAVRVEHEIAWMVEEGDAIGALGDQIVTAEPQATGVATALAALRAAPLTSLHYDDVAAIQKGFASPEGRAAVADVQNFATGGVDILMFDTRPV